MQFYKKTSIGKSYNYTSLIIKIVLAILALSLIIFFLGKINFPAPNKIIKQEIPRENLKISEIFKTKGEGYFRELEFNVTLQSLDGDNNIITLGGGAFMNKELRKVLKQKSSTFWLHWNADTLIKRIKNNDKRPIIKGLDNAEIKKLINERNKIYYFSDFKIICESLKKAEVVDKIIKKCKKNEIIC